MTAYHEEQRFHGAFFAMLLGALLVATISTIAGLLATRSAEPWAFALGPAAVVLIAVLLTLSHLDVDVDERGVRIAFRYLWPARRIAFGDITTVAVRRYWALWEYGGWGVRLGPAGWAYVTGGDVGVQLRLRRGLPVLIGSRRPEELEAAIRAGMARGRPG
ncbi:MAG: hypothetical protein E6I51_07585 [Chloroflexi bacterium]|nr:MAG: hypothetical protein E6I51_07585 [Chloroflexota bacterium]